MVRKGVYVNQGDLPVDRPAFMQTNAKEPDRQESERP